jgi:hypothetical protein
MQLANQQLSRNGCAFLVNFTSRLLPSITSSVVQSSVFLRHNGQSTVLHADHGRMNDEFKLAGRRAGVQDGWQDPPGRLAGGTSPMMNPLPLLFLLLLLLLLLPAAAEGWVNIVSEAEVRECAAHYFMLPARLDAKVWRPRSSRIWTAVLYLFSMDISYAVQQVRPVRQASPASSACMRSLACVHSFACRGHPVGDAARVSASARVLLTCYRVTLHPEECTTASHCALIAHLRCQWPSAVMKPSH